MKTIARANFPVSRAASVGGRPFEFAFLSVLLLYARLVLYLCQASGNSNSKIGESWLEFVGSGFLLSANWESGLGVGILTTILSWLGFGLVQKRIADCRWHPLWALLFFVPYANVVFWGLLCTLQKPVNSKAESTQSGQRLLCDFPVWTAFIAAIVGTVVAMGLTPLSFFSDQPEHFFWETSAFGLLVYSTVAASFFVSIICSARTTMGIDDCFQIGILATTFAATGLGIVGIGEPWAFFLVPVLAVPSLFGTLLGQLFADMIQRGVLAVLFEWLA